MMNHLGIDVANKYVEGSPIFEIMAKNEARINDNMTIKINLIAPSGFLLSAFSMTIIL